MAYIFASPKKLIRCNATELGVPKSTEHDVLPKAKFHPYELQLLRHLSEDDTDRHVEMFEQFLSSNEANPYFLQGVLFSDEANLYVNGEVNKENSRYWSQENPNWCSAYKESGAKRLIVRHSIWDPHVTKPFFNSTATAESYLNMSGGCLMSALEQGADRLKWFMQDGAPPHYALSVRHCYDKHFKDSYSGL
jgi:hypothetical protein